MKIKKLCKTFLYHFKPFVLSKTKEPDKRHVTQSIFIYKDDKYISHQQQKQRKICLDTWVSLSNIHAEYNTQQIQEQIMIPRIIFYRYQYTKYKLLPKPKPNVEDK